MSLIAKDLMTFRRRIRIVLTEYLSEEHGRTFQLLKNIWLELGKKAVRAN